MCNKPFYITFCIVDLLCYYVFNVIMLPNDVLYRPYMFYTKFRDTLYNKNILNIPELSL